MKKFLEKLIARKQKEIDEMLKRSDNSEDIAEVRSLGQQIRKAQEEIEEARTQLAACSAGLDNARAEAEEGENGENEGEGGEDDEEGEQPTNNQRARNFKPGTEVRSFDLRGGQNRVNAEKRAKAFAATGRMAIESGEARATLISGGKIATPTEVGGINDAFTQVSSIVDMVKVTDCEGMGAYKVAYEIASATAAKQTEGETAAESDMTYDFVTITPETEAVVSYISKQVRKQSPLNYAAKVQASALTALRKRASKLIVDKIKASTLKQALTLTAIDATTLRKLALNYGGTLGVEGGAVLYLCKADLIKFGDVRGTQEKKAVYEITPDAGNPNTGIIKDGGLSVKYCLNSDLTEGSLLYGDPMCFELGLFSNYEIVVSEDRNVEKLMLTIVGDVEIGGEIVVKDGFIVATVGAAG